MNRELGERGQLGTHPGCYPTRGFEQGSDSRVDLPSITKPSKRLKSGKLNFAYVSQSEVNTLLAEIGQKVPRELQQYLDACEGAAILCQNLPQLSKPDFVNILSKKYERVRLDLAKGDVPTTT